jgi:hypothetical protein
MVRRQRYALAHSEGKELIPPVHTTLLAGLDTAYESFTTGVERIKS